MPRRVRVLVLTATLGLLLVGSLASAPGAIGGGGCHADVTGAAHGDAVTTVVRMDACSFEPTVARVPVGARVTFLNTASLDHVVAGRGNAWGGETMRPGESLVTSFREAGVFPYSCPLHPGMVGAVVVGDGAMAPVASVDPPAAAAPGTGAGVDPLLAAGLGGSVGLAVVAAGLLVLRRRPAAGSGAG